MGVDVPSSVTVYEGMPASRNRRRRSAQKESCPPEKLGGGWVSRPAIVLIIVLPEPPFGDFEPLKLVFVIPIFGEPSLVQGRMHPHRPQSKRETGLYGCSLETMCSYAHQTHEQ